jgi:hypothetical protein
MALQTLSEHAGFGGVQGFHQHDSGTIGLPLRRHGGCDHGCCFIASVVEDPLRHHGASLTA